MKKQKILFVECDENSLSNIRQILKDKKKSWEIFFATTIKEAITKCDEISFDLIIANSKLKNIDEEIFIKILQYNELTKYIPVIALIGQNSTSERLALIELGISEFISKPFIPEEFILRIENVFKLKNLNEELIKKSQLLEHFSHNDTLTGLYKKKYIIDYIEREISIYKRYRRPFSLLLFDIDNLKSFNEKFGQSVGDDLLVQIAKTLNSTLRKTDILSRYEDDEFLILLPETNLKGSEMFIQRIIENINEIKIMNQPVYISGGAAEFKGEKIDDFFNILNNFIKEAKKSHKSNIVH